jgi:hypothetical protein
MGYPAIVRDQRSRNELPRIGVLGADHRKVTPVKGGEPLDVQTLTHNNHRTIHRPERQISIPGHQLGDAEPITGGDRLDGEVAPGQVAEQPDLCVGPQARADQIDNLGDNQLGNQQRPGMGPQEVE